MPGTAKKDLYIAKTVGQLNELAELPAKFKNTSAKLLVKTADKMLKEAQHSDMLQDEERAYVLFMKYFNVVTFLKKSPDYKKQKAYFDDLLGSKNLLTSINKAEELSASLKERYDLHEAEAVADKLSKLDTIDKKPSTPDTSDSKNDDKADSKKNDKSSSNLKTESTDIKKEEVISTTTPAVFTSSKLYDLLEDRDAQVIIMDVRSIEDFQESRVNYKNVINVPGSVIKPGTTVTYIEKALPMDSLSLWQQRGNIDHIVLIDWKSKMADVKIGTPLQTLKDALFKYDSNVIIKSEPLILEGGYEDWMLQYPTKCVNPVFDKLTKPVVSSTQDSLMDFDYPDFEETVLKPAASHSDTTAPPGRDSTTLSRGGSIGSLVSSTSSSSVTESLNGDISGTMPRIDRSTKPKIDRSTKSNLTSIQTSKPKTDSLYPDVVTLSKPGTNKSTKNSSDFSYADSRASLHSDSVARAGNEDIKNTQSKDLDADIKHLDEQKRQKIEEIKKLEQDYERMKAESQRKLRQMKEEETRLSDLEEKKRKQQTDVADLMRMKKTLQNDIAREEHNVVQQQQHQHIEETNRKEELSQLEEEKRRREAEVNKLRLERKRKEEEKIEEERRKREEKSIQEANERARVEDERRRNENAAAADRARLLEEETKRKEMLQIEERLRMEKELQAELEKLRLAALEEKRKQQAEIDQLEAAKRETLRLEREKLERERLEREKKERDEADRKKAEEAKRIADEKLRLINEAKTKPKAVPSPNLPVGWGKQLDSRTNRYYYVNHNDNSTQWEPPVMLGETKSGNFTTKLKTEPSTPKSNLKRSNSSPNVAQLLDDDELLMQKKLPTPAVNRSVKPVKRLMPVALPAKRRDLNPIHGNMGRALTGLRNLGNTCYMNSTIQCLNNTSPLVTYLLTDSYLYDINRDSKSGSLWEVTDDFAYLVKALWSGQYRCITPRDFKSVVGRQQPMFAGFEQQDSQEFLTFLLDGLHEGLNKVKTRPKISEQDNDDIPDFKAAEIAWRDHKLHNESIIVELFQGQLKSTIMCLTCRKQSVTFQAFMFLSLPIPSSHRCTLQDCLRQFAAEEKMTGSSQWKCPRCRTYRDSVKKIEIWKLPAILLIALNRFVYEGQWRTKINANVDFPVRGLDMSSYVKGPQPRPYRLYAASNHFGTLDGGHYTACCRNPITQKWYKFDDNDVYEMSESGVKTSAAYVLYYTSIELKPPEYRPIFS